jgi:predicted nucleotidyltransferase
MADAEVIRVVQQYLGAVRRAGLRASRAILFGSYARGTAQAESDIDLLVIAEEFDGAYDRALVDLLWELRAITDSRIEPLAVGERQWREDDDSMILEIARREGQEIVAPAVS